MIMMINELITIIFRLIKKLFYVIKYILINFELINGKINEKLVITNIDKTWKASWILNKYRINNKVSKSCKIVEIWISNLVW